MHEPVVVLNNLKIEGEMSNLKEPPFVTAGGLTAAQALPRHMWNWTFTLELRPTDECNDKTIF